MRERRSSAARLSKAEKAPTPETTSKPDLEVIEGGMTAEEKEAHWAVVEITTRLKALELAMKINDAKQAQENFQAAMNEAKKMEVLSPIDVLRNEGDLDEEELEGLTDVYERYIGDTAEPSGATIQVTSGNFELDGMNPAQLEALQASVLQEMHSPRLKGTETSNDPMPDNGEHGLDQLTRAQLEMLSTELYGLLRHEEQKNEARRQAQNAEVRTNAMSTLTDASEESTLGADAQAWNRLESIGEATPSETHEVNVDSAENLREQLALFGVKLNSDGTPKWGFLGRNERKYNKLMKTNGDFADLTVKLAQALADESHTAGETRVQSRIQRTQSNAQVMGGSSRQQQSSYSVKRTRR